MRRVCGLLALAGLLLAGCYDSAFREPSGDGNGPPQTMSIRELRGLYNGKTVPVTGDIVLAGTVTTSDRAGNFYRTLCIEEEGAGLEILAGIDRLHNDYPVGCRVKLSLRGLAVGMSRNILQVGRMPAPGNGSAAEYIGSKQALDRSLIRTGRELQPLSPAVCRIADLTTEACGRLVRIEGVRYAPGDPSPGNWSGYKRFTDETGAEIYTYVRDYARFADEEVPSGYRSLTGILQHDNTGRYILKPRDEDDLFY